MCGRLPYDFKALYYDPEEDCDVTDIVDDISSYGYVGLGSHYSLTIESIKPYLFPMSSMTNEQKDVYHSFYADILRGLITPANSVKMIEWLNKNHFDYRGLIEKGLVY